MGLYETVKSLCKEKGYSIRILEMKAGFGNGTISKWKYHNPQLKSIVKVADALEIPAAKLMEGAKHDYARSKRRKNG